MKNFMVVCLITALTLTSTSCAAILPKDTVCGTVTGKERVNSDENSYYLIFTDNDVFKNVDDLSVMKFNSSDIYAQLNEGEEYCFTVAGYRIPLISMYKNIIDFTQGN